MIDNHIFHFCFQHTSADNIDKNMSPCTFKSANFLFVLLEYVVDSNLITIEDQIIRNVHRNLMTTRRHKNNDNAQLYNNQRTITVIQNTNNNNKHFSFPIKNYCFFFCIFNDSNSISKWFFFIWIATNSI